MLTNLEKRYLQLIQTECKRIATKKYPDRPDLQALYQIGFLQSQLAQAMATDNYTRYAFSSAVDALD